MHQGIHDHLTSLSVPSHAGVVNAADAALDVRCDGRPDSYVQEHKQQCSAVTHTRGDSSGVLYAVRSQQAGTRLLVMPRLSLEGST